MCCIWPLLRLSGLRLAPPRTKTPIFKGVLIKTIKRWIKITQEDDTGVGDGRLLDFWMEPRSEAKNEGDYGWKFWTPVEKGNCSRLFQIRSFGDEQMLL
jgi:hypothetical protein